MTKPKMYIAAPLFSVAEKNFNVGLKQRMSKWFDVYLPQEDGGLLVDMIDRGMGPSDAGAEVFKWDMQAINDCHVFLIVLDGLAVDGGAMFELGVAFTKGKPCVALQTDPRRLLVTGNSPMVMNAITHYSSSVARLEMFAESMKYNALKNKTDQKDIIGRYDKATGDAYLDGIMKKVNED